jgi:hypothetical protein
VADRCGADPSCRLEAARAHRNFENGAGTDTLIFNGSDRTPTDPFETESLHFDSDGTQSTIVRQPDA